MKHKHYPEKSEIRHRGKAVADAMKHLTKKSIEIMGIDLRTHVPVIEIYHCAGNDRLESTGAGNGADISGKYVRKMAHISGCEVIWNEYQN